MNHEVVTIELTARTCVEPGAEEEDDEDGVTLYRFYVS